MEAYYFPFWRKQFFFHASALDDSNLLSIYHPYNSSTRLAWKVWKRSKLLRSCCVPDQKCLHSSLAILNEIIENLNDFSWVINLGTKGEEQKTTILLRSKVCSEKLLFVKIGTTQMAKELVRNEINTLKEFSLNPFFPRLFSYGDQNEYIFMITDAFPAQKVSHKDVDTGIFEIIFSIASLKPTYINRNNTLFYSFGHGDFCPWNILEMNHEYKIIDWEFANFYPLGYDLFTYLFQTSFSLTATKTIRAIIQENELWIKRYFNNYQIENYIPYLKEFARIKEEKERCKKNSPLVKSYKSLINSL